MRVFGETQAGETVHAIDLRAYGLSTTILTYGAILQDLRLGGVDRSLTLGSDRLEDYETNLAFHGSIAGPVCNRISGAAAPIAGETHRFEVNYRHRHCLHSASSGTHKKIWNIDFYDQLSCQLSVNLPAGLAGFPGNRRIEAEFSLHPDGTLQLAIRTTTDAPTLVNLTNHSYWNLDGSDSFAGHTLRVDADRYLPADEDFVPTGEVATVAGTALDFRPGARPAPGAPDFDNTFVPNTPAGTLRDVLWLTGQSGIEMTVATDQPGIHIFDCRGAARPGKSPYEGIAVEAQGWPDAPNKPGFPSIDLMPGETRVQTTQWRFRAL